MIKSLIQFNILGNLIFKDKIYNRNPIYKEINYNY